MGVRRGGARGALALPPLYGLKQYAFRLFWQKQYLFGCFLGKKQVLAPPWKFFALPGKKSADAHGFEVMKTSNSDPNYPVKA